MNGTPKGFDAESKQSGSPHAQSNPSSPGRRVIRHEPAKPDSGATLEAIFEAPGSEDHLDWEVQSERLAFLEFSRELKDDLAPSDTLEAILADRVVLSAWRLKGALRAEEVWTTHEATRQHLPAVSRLRCEPLNDLRRDSARAQGALRRAMDDLDRHRRRRSPGWGKASKSDPREAPRPDFDHDPTARPAASAGGNEWPVLPNSPVAPPLPRSSEPVEHPCWRDRLIFDQNVSEYSPVIKGTWLTVNHVVSFVVDGWTWADILKAHPEIAEDDIRACLAYATEEEAVGA